MDSTRIGQRYFSGIAIFKTAYRRLRYASTLLAGLHGRWPSSSTPAALPSHIGDRLLAASLPVRAVSKGGYEMASLNYALARKHSLPRKDLRIPRFKRPSSA